MLCFPCHRCPAPRKWVEFAFLIWQLGLWWFGDWSWLRLNAFKKYPPQNRTNVQIKGGGGQRPFEQCSKKFGHCSKICAMFKNSMFELRWRPLKSWAMGHLVFGLIGSQLLSSLKKLKTFALEFIFRVETHCWQYTHHNKLRMAISDVLTVYQSWKHLQLFDEVKVQMHRSPL